MGRNKGDSGSNSTFLLRDSSRGSRLEESLELASGLFNPAHMAAWTEPCFLPVGALCFLDVLTLCFLSVAVPKMGEREINDALVDSLKRDAS